MTTVTMASYRERYEYVRKLDTGLTLALKEKDRQYSSHWTAAIDARSFKTAIFVVFEPDRIYVTDRSRLLPHCVSLGGCYIDLTDDEAKDLAQFIRTAKEDDTGRTGDP